MTSDIQAAAESCFAQGVKVVTLSNLTAIVHQNGRQYTITGSVEIVTTDIAKAWLEGKHVNRKSSERRVKSYGRDRLADKWMVTSQAIGFDTNNRLIDGEHRLRMVIDTGLPTAFLVIRGMPAETQHVIDNNRVRTFSDQFGMWTGTDRAKDRTAAANIIRLIMNGWTVEAEILTHAEKAETLDRYKPELDWAMTAFAGRRSNIQPAAVVGAWAYAYGATNEVARWVESFTDGAGLERGDPLLGLRNYLITNASRSVMTRRSIALRTLRALWGKVNGEKLSKLYDSSEGLIGFARLRNDPVAESWLDWTTRTPSPRNLSLDVEG